MPVSQIISLEPAGGYNGQHGYMFTFRVAMADGVSGTVNAKTNPPAKYRAGQQVYYDTDGMHNGVTKLKITANLSGFGPPGGQASPPPPQAQQQWAPPPAGATVAPQNAAPATPPPVYNNGSAVGASVARAIEMLTKGLDRSEIVKLIPQPVFWESIHQTASEVFRINQLMERNHLYPSVCDPKPTTPPASRPVAGPGGAVAIPPGDDDVPF